jgi:hypothetical protein
MTLEDTIFQRYAGESPATLEDDEFIHAIKTGYSEDKLFSSSSRNHKTMPDFQSRKA